MPSESLVRFRALDGLHLAGTFVAPNGPEQRKAGVLVHGSVALAEVRDLSGAARLSLLGASFAGGVCVYYAAKRTLEIDRLVLLNPQLDSKKRRLTAAITGMTTT